MLQGQALAWSVVISSDDGNFLRGCLPNSSELLIVALHPKSAQLEGFPHKFVMIVRISTHGHPQNISHVPLLGSSSRLFSQNTLSSVIWVSFLMWKCNYDPLCDHLGDFCQRWKPRTRARSASALFWGESHRDGGSLGIGTEEPPQAYIIFNPQIKQQLAVKFITVKQLLISVPRVW